jgi:hypothetical protein
MVRNRAWDVFQEYTFVAQLRSGVSNWYIELHQGSVVSMHAIDHTMIPDLCQSLVDDGLAAPIRRRILAVPPLPTTPVDRYARPP